MVVMDARAHVVISRHGGADARRLPVAGVQTSWELNGLGAFSAFARLDDVRAAGLAGSLAGRWLEWGDPAVGRWGGVLIGRPVSDGTPELAAEGWAALLRGRILESSETDDAVPAEPGGHLRRAFANGTRDGESFIALDALDEGGEPLALALDGQDLLDDTLSALADDGGIEWFVDADRVLHAGRRLGRDRSATVRLVEGRHITDYRFADDAWAVSAAETLAVETPEAQASGDWAYSQPISPRQRRRPRRRRVAGSRDAWRPGRRRARVTVTDVDVRTGPGGPDFFADWDSLPPGLGVRSLATPETRQHPRETTPLELTLANVDACWRLCDLGDVVRVLIGSAPFAGWFRVMTRGYDSSEGTLTVAGEALADARGF